ncbi:MAG: hypothetical protein ACC654_09435 [Acidimicrobiia bacterium]
MDQSSHSVSSQVDGLAQLLTTTGNNHHEAFIETDGFDPDWAIWYADQALDQVNSQLGTSMSRAELIDELVGLSRKQPTDAPDTPWPEYYSSSLINRRQT